MAAPSLQNLPEELLLQVFECLDSVPPSGLKSRQEPRLSLTDACQSPLKCVSSVSKRWRRVVLPMLFQHTRIRLDRRHQYEHVCNACGIPTESDSHGESGYWEHHQEQAEWARNNFPGGRRDLSEWRAALQDAPVEQATMIWSFVFHHHISEFVAFVTRNRLSKAVRSFAILSDGMFKYQNMTSTPYEAGTDWRYFGAAMLWQHLFAAVDPKQILILASPHDLACLTNTVIANHAHEVGRELRLHTREHTWLTSMREQDWAFSDMDFHILELHKDSCSPPQYTQDAVIRTQSERQVFPLRYQGSNICSCKRRTVQRLDAHRHQRRLISESLRYIRILRTWSAIDRQLNSG